MSLRPRRAVLSHASAAALVAAALVAILTCWYCSGGLPGWEYVVLCEIRMTPAYRGIVYSTGTWAITLFPAKKSPAPPVP